MKPQLRMQPLWAVLLVTPLALLVAFKATVALTAFNPADQPTGYVAQDEMTNYNLKGDHEFLFRGHYEREYWNGGLLAYPADKFGNVDTAAPAWDLAEALDLQNPDTGRFIATMKDDGTGVAFRLAQLSAAQQAYLDGSADLVAFLRGDRSKEGSPYRLRGSALGDIVHSRPLYVADATNPTVFVGSNDGMLHAVNASTPDLGSGVGGSERWAYVPSMLLPKLKKLAVNPYVHEYFVDGQINVATIDSGAQRILVGGLGAGGKGLYALDISGTSGLTAASEADVASKVLWEITPTKVKYAAPATTNAYVNLGYTYGTVTIARMKVSGTPTDVVIVGNGYNDGVGDYSGCTDGAPSYSTCGGDYAARLFVIDAATGQLITSIKAGASASAASPNGLWTPAAIDTDGDGMVDRVYAGDLDGTMWKFDLAAGTATALLTTSPAQPITTTPAVAIHPLGGYMVMFATGKMLVPADTTDTTVHYAYGAWDGAPAANAVLLGQTLTERSYTRGGNTIRVRRVTSNAPNWSSGAANHKGWRVPLPAGERAVGEGSFVENGRFYFTSHNPNVSTPVPDTTTNIMGENWLMELDYLTGGSRNQPFLDLSGDVKLDNDDRIRYIASDPEVVADPAKLDTPIPGTDGIAVGKFISTGVLSQPILVQLLSLNDTLFNQNPDVTIPPVVLGQGVDGGHFDQDIYYGTGDATKAFGTVNFRYAASRTAKNVSFLRITANGELLYSGAPGNIRPRALDDFLDGMSSANYVISANYDGNNSMIKIEAKATGDAYNGPITVEITTSGLSGADAYEKEDLAGGSAATVGDRCIKCKAKNHIHQYDDKYDVTGVNVLNPSNTAQNIVKAIPDETTEFKVLVHNQYLNPAVKLHIGTPGYLFDVDTGYVRVKDYMTSATLDLAAVPTYRRAATASGTAQPIQSFTYNMPTDALSARDWWGNGDVRVGLHPTIYYCAYSSAGTNDGNMYRPVVPPANGVDGPGTNGWSSATTPATATGARHNGALTFQLIAASTPNSAIEQNVPGRPEYGWRVKSSEFSRYVLAEYNVYWHHPNGKCYGDAGWTKTPGPDNGSSSPSAKAAGSTDPKIGDLGVGAGSITDVTTTTVGDVTTTVITYSSGLTATIVRTANRTNGQLDGSVTIVTTDTLGQVTTHTIASPKGSVRSGGDERGLQARTGRISWRELVAP